jgi:hypothetical protein
MQIDHVPATARCASWNAGVLLAFPDVLLPVISHICTMAAWSLLRRGTRYPANEACLPVASYSREKSG